MIKFNFDFSLDKSGFFDSIKQNLFNEAGNLLSPRLKKTLPAIISSGQNTLTIYPANIDKSNFSILENILYIYIVGSSVSSSELADSYELSYSCTGSTEWNNLLKSRPLGGTINININKPFSIIPQPGRFDFLSMILHELGHILGIGMSKEWSALVKNNTFNGSLCTQIYGSPIPLDNNNVHWKDQITFAGSETAMDPMTFDNKRKLFTGLDYAALVDIGWGDPSFNFIRKLYKLYLGREVDASGLIYWRQQFYNYGLNFVTKGIGQSQEAKLGMIKNYYRVWLNREASVNEINYWIGTQMNLEEICLAIAGSLESLMINS